MTDGFEGHANAERGEPVKERLLKSSAFTQVYEAAYWDLYRKIYGNGDALTALDEITAVVKTTEGK